MKETTTRQPPRRPARPSAAERARTIATRGSRAGEHAALLPHGDPRSDIAGSDFPGGGHAGAGYQGRVVPLLHHEHTDGTATILLSDEHPLIAALWHAPRGELTAMLEIADPTPVRLREPVRGLLWLTGRLRALGEEEARPEVVAISEHRPDPRLLDAGHGATVLRLESVTLVVADAEGTCSVQPDEFAAARPDPFCLHEDGWLRHLEISHRDVVGLLARHLPEHLRGGHIRPLGLDKYGLRLRVESEDGDHDVRLAFEQAVTDTHCLGHELRRLVGCPFLAGQRA